MQFSFTLPRLVLLNVVLVVGSAGLGWARSADPGHYFGEGRLPTVISVLQLLATAFFAAQIFRQRSCGAPGRALLGERGVWAAVASGFVYLALDEAFKFHERLGQALQIPDERLIVLYGGAGLLVMALCRREVLRYRSALFLPLAAGFIALVLSVLCDALTHREALVRAFDALALAVEPGQITAVKNWFEVGDGGFTLIAEAFFVAGFSAAARLASAGQRAGRTASFPA